MPFFSVIIPTFNRAEKLRRALESVVSQTFSDYEVIVCDDGSIDHTREIVDSFTGRIAIKYLREENWGGPARPRNNGLKAACGEWVCFLDADDWWFPGKLSTVFAAIGNADVVHHDCDVFDGSVKKIIKMRGRQLSTPVFIDLMTGWNALHTSTVCVKKTILEDAGGFSEERALIAIEDFDLWLRISRVTDRFSHIPRLLGAYEVSNGSISSFSTESIERETLIHERYVAQLAPTDRREATKMLAYRKGIILWHLGRNSESRKMFIDSLGARRFRTKILAPLWIAITVFITRNNCRRNPLTNMDADR
jgi:glycosyltransferase involved in cell wall biosynthesis